MCAKEILTGIYDAEYATEVRIHLADSKWAIGSTTSWTLVDRMLETEARNVPQGLQHVLRLRGLKQHLSVRGQLTRLGWKCRDARQ